ncbi:SNF1-related protein kinase regulatory subunit gamma-1-like [Lathyrus oleraceus]|uniref:SNF1-related protein kinase regulatory subunit gamma-1-like n=1 Tax=Pisum sativum TaxID=3888 RepID=UPI0021D02981|nr:SNF1-related protein kinase regulatory subunit gamma-1-like [Pisum sativum]
MDDQRTLRQFAAPDANYNEFCIEYSDVSVPFELKSGLGFSVSPISSASPIFSSSSTDSLPLYLCSAALGFSVCEKNIEDSKEVSVVPYPSLLVADKTMAKYAPQAANNLGEDFYKVILQEEPFKSTTVGSMLKLYRWAPFVPVAKNSAMLTVLLLLSKYRLRNVPVIEPGNPNIVNFITQSAVVQGTKGCRGRDWFDSIAARPLSDLGLPFMSTDKVISVQSNELILEAFKIMRDHQIGGLPVVEGSTKTIVGNLSIRDIRYLLLKPEIFSNFRFLLHHLFILTFRNLTVMDYMKKIVSASYEPGTS